MDRSKDLRRGGGEGRMKINHRCARPPSPYQREEVPNLYQKIIKNKIKNIAFFSQTGVELFYFIFKEGVEFY